MYGNKISILAKLKLLINRNRKNQFKDCTFDEASCDGAFAFDLNGDKRMEYLVRLDCGATGNCLYGIFTDRRPRLIGTFTAWFFWVEKSRGDWKRIITYTREGGDQGYIEKHAA